MIRMKKLEELENIATRYPLILLDTSIFMDYYKKEGKGLVRESNKFFKFIMDSIENTPLFITPLVERECVRGFIPYKKRIKKGHVDVSKCRQTEKLRKKYLRLIGCFESHGRILQFSDPELHQYEPIYAHYYFFSPNLGETDLDLATSGTIISNSRKCAIFSNDLGILHHLQNYRQKGRNKKIAEMEENLGFFIRANGNHFKQMYIC